MLCLKQQNAQFHFFTHRWRSSMAAQIKFETFEKLFVFEYTHFLWLTFPKLCPIWRVSGSRAPTWAPTSAMRIDLKLNTRYMTKCCSTARKKLIKRAREKRFNRSDSIFLLVLFSIVYRWPSVNLVNHKNVVCKIPSQKQKITKLVN